MNVHFAHVCYWTATPPFLGKPSNDYKVGSHSNYGNAGKMGSIGKPIIQVNYNGNAGKVGIIGNTGKVVIE